MTALRLIGLIIWAIVLIRLSPAAIRTVRGRQGFYDPLWTVLWSISLIIVGANARWLLIPESTATWAALYALTILCGAGTLMVVRSYEPR